MVVPRNILDLDIVTINGIDVDSAPFPDLASFLQHLGMMIADYVNHFNLVTVLLTFLLDVIFMTDLIPMSTTRYHLGWTGTFICGNYN